MARSLNKVILIGNVGSDPEVRAVGSGARVANFSLATSRRWNDRSGQQQEKTEWHRIVAWDNERGQKLADIAERFIKKGSSLYVEGELEYRSYDDKDGNTKYITEIRAREIILLGGKGEGGGGGDFERSSRPSSNPAATKPGARGGGAYDDFQAPSLEDDDDLPF